MNRVQRKISREIKKRIDQAIDKYYEGAEITQLENGRSLIKVDTEALIQLVEDTARHRVKKQVIKDFKEQGIL